MKGIFWKQIFDFFIMSFFYSYFLKINRWNPDKSAINVKPNSRNIREPFSLSSWTSFFVCFNLKKNFQQNFCPENINKISELIFLQISSNYAIWSLVRSKAVREILILTFTFFPGWLEKKFCGDLFRGNHVGWLQSDFDELHFSIVLFFDRNQANSCLKRRDKWELVSQQFQPRPGLKLENNMKCWSLKSWDVTKQSKRW